jgi:hypothetical protein
MKYRRRLRSAIAVLAVGATATGLTALAGAQAAAAAVTPRINLNVLVITDGTSSVSAIQSELTREGVATTVVNLNSASRPAITTSFLQSSATHGNFEGVVTPGDLAPGLADPLTSAEEAALASYEAKFSVREVDAYVDPAVDGGSYGLKTTPVYYGNLDGTAARVTGAARPAGFGYLRGPLTFQGFNDDDPALAFGALAVPAAGFTPYLTGTFTAGSGTKYHGTLAGVYASGGRQQLVFAYGYSSYVLEFRYLAPGIVNWLTRGVHFGAWHNYLSTQVGGVFGSVPPFAYPGGPTAPIQMTGADVAAARSWERAHGMKLDMVFNGGDAKAGSLLTAAQADARSFRWVNGTYANEFLGCQQVFAGTSFTCATSGGSTVYVSAATVDSQIRSNDRWARRHGIPVRSGELVTFANSGPAIPPQQPNDNPNFDSRLGPDGVRYLDLNSAIDPAARRVGAALGVPQFALDVFDNVDSPAGETAEWNAIYATTLPLASGWSSYIRPELSGTALEIALQNQPEPLFAGQAGLTGSRLAYQVLDDVLGTYRGVYAVSAPLLNPSLTDAGEVLRAQAAWGHAAGTVSGYVQGDRVTLTGPAGTKVPFTAAYGTRLRGRRFGSVYGAERSGTITLRSSRATLVLPGTPFAAGRHKGAPAVTRRITVRPVRLAGNPARVPGGRRGAEIRKVTIGG